MAFQRHGCEVSAVCPPGHPLRFVSGIDSICDYKGFTPIESLRIAIRATEPALIVPCDDIAVWQLQVLHAEEADLRALIELSLGDPEAYPIIRQRVEVLRIAQGLGIRVPLTQTLDSAAALKEWNFDKPAVLKLDGSWGGEGVTVVHSILEATRRLHSAPKTMKAWMAWKRFLINRHYFALWARKTRTVSRMSIQEFIPGRAATSMFACWRGEVLASSTVEVLISQGPTGAASVVQLLECAEVEEAVRLMARKLQLSGFHGLDFILEQNTGAAYLVELNPRATQVGHLNLSTQGDLAGVMARKIRAETWDERAAGENQIQRNAIALFPQTYKTDSECAYLYQGYHDVPWDEPALVHELLRDAWPDRQWPSRIYCYLGFGKKVDSNAKPADRSALNFGGKQPPFGPPKVWRSR